MRPRKINKDDLLFLYPELNNRIIPDNAKIIASGNHLFFAHPRCRFAVIGSLLVGTAATSTTVATVGLIGSGGAITGAGLAMGVGTGIMATSTIMQGRAAQAQGKAEKELLEYNARVQEAEGKARMSAAMLAEERLSEQQKKVRGYQRAAFAKGGISIEEGASVDVLAETYGQFAMDRLLTLRGGLLEQTALEQQAAISRAQGKMAAQRGRSALKASYLTAAGQMGIGMAMAGMRFGGTPLKMNTINAPPSALKGMPTGYMGMGW